jgi:hypothetical protein
MSWWWIFLLVPLGVVLIIISVLGIVALLEILWGEHWEA